MQPTDEQKQAVHLFGQRKPLLVIQAAAGAGKTTTLRMLAESDNRRGLYLAYNKEIVKSATGKFGQMDVTTTHSLAYRHLGIGRGPYKAKLERSENNPWYRERLGIDESVCDISPMSIAYTARRAVFRYCCSGDTDIDIKHCHHEECDVRYFKRFLVTKRKMIESRAEAEAPALETLFRKHVLQFARKLLSWMLDPNDECPIDHELYLKMFALEAPILGYDYILLDEGQDTNGCVLGWVLKQPCPIVIVGDPYQQLYRFRGSFNAMDNLQNKADSVSHLTMSFRFGDEIADLAMEALSLRADAVDFTLHGAPWKRSRVVESVGYPLTVLCRTNAGVISAAIAAVKRNKQDIRLLGNVKDLCNRLSSIDALQKGQTERVTHPSIVRYTSFADLEDDALHDMELKSLIKLMEKFGNIEKVTKLMFVLAKNKNPDAQITISNVHQVKGLEFPSVYMYNDFNFPEEPDEPLSDDESNTLYVCVTRAQNVIKPCRKLLDALEGPRQALIA